MKWKQKVKLEDHYIVASGFPRCSHAYIVSKFGANKLLRYSLPHITSVDLLISMLQRNHVIKMYSVTPNIFNYHNFQECDKNMRKKHTKNRDRKSMHIIKNSPMQYFTTRLRPSYSNANRVVENCDVNHINSKSASFPVNNVKQIVLWCNNNVMNHDSLHIDLKHFNLPICESCTSVPSGSLVVSLSNHFFNIPVFSTENIYIFFMVYLRDTLEVKVMCFNGM